MATPLSLRRLLSPAAPTTRPAAASLCCPFHLHNHHNHGQQVRGYKQERIPPRMGPPIPSPTAAHPEIPPYPLGPRQLYKQSNTGLYGTARIRFGNTVSRETEIINPQKNRRKWRPNVQEKRLWSASLRTLVRTRITTRVLRTVDKVGGLDEYLLGSKPARIAELGPWGWRLRWRIMQTPAVQERFRLQRIELGLPPEGLPIEDEAGSGSMLASQQDSAPGEQGSDAQLHQDAAPSAAETQRMIDGGEVFDLAPEEFMQEESRPKKP